MKREMFFILLVSGLCHFSSPHLHRHYQFINQPMTWHQAQNYCREEHTDLATVDSMEDMKQLARLVKVGVSNVWLGMYRVWGWTLSQSDDYQEGEAEYSNWKVNEPGRKGHCGVMSMAGGWRATNCTRPKPFFCYNGSATEISKRFILVETSRPWFEARDYCRRHHTNLARMRNELENQEMQKMAPNSAAWIGLMGMVWRWSDGSESSFQSWEPEQPSAERTGDTMEGRRPVALFVLGLSMLSSCLLHEYHFIGERKKWPDALSYCREIYTDLATLHNMEDLRKIHQIIDDNKAVEDAWTGLKREGETTGASGKWQWSLADEDQYGEGERDYRKWARGHPKYTEGDEDCAVFDRGYWHNTHCSERKFSFVCLSGAGRGVYTKVDDPKTWTEAQRYCRQHHTDLASVRNQAENQEIQKVVPETQQVWIGLFRDSWTWSDGSDSSFRYWVSGAPVNNPQKNCVRYFKEGGGLVNRLCYIKRPFICYKDSRRQVLRLKLSPQDSSVDLNDPDVMEAILKL
ncbi:C-type mannose receptor 2-like, partial [Centroberyx affinis]|uniref:C-type mannose receptor 2-like n=1 Tax=Centroberyx affinis TaxID=166261 RepID=UPI003A5C69F6